MVIPPAFIADTSFVLSWAFEDEHSSVSDAAWQALRSGQTSITVPALWLWEVVNALVQKEKRGRITENGVADFLAILQELPVKVLPTLITPVFRELPDYMRRFQLSSYDAEYLVAAERARLPLATFDETLSAAAKKLGIETLGC